MKTLACIVASLLACPLAADAFCRAGVPCRMTDAKNLFGTLRCHMPTTVLGLPVVKPSEALTHQAVVMSKKKLRNAHVGDLKLGQRVRLVQMHGHTIDALAVGFIPSCQDLYVEFVNENRRFVVHGLHYALISTTESIWLRHHRVIRREKSSLEWTTLDSQYR